MLKNANTLLVNRAIISEGDQILLLQRAGNDSHNPSLWEFPGGKVDAAEELFEGLAREVREETGLLIGVSKSIAHVESELIQAGKYKGRLYVALFYAAQRLSGDLVLSNEHSNAKWEDYTAATKYDLTQESQNALAALNDIKLI